MNINKALIYIYHRSLINRLNVFYPNFFLSFVSCRVGDDGTLLDGDDNNDDDDAIDDEDFGDDDDPFQQFDDDEGYDDPDEDDGGNEAYY